MCTVCGCETSPILVSAIGEHVHHYEQHRKAQRAGIPIDFGGGATGVSVPGLTHERTIRVEREILAKNNSYADNNRARLRARNIFALNFLSSPGSGKTSLLVRTIAELLPRFPIAVIEGDQQTSNDSDKIRAAGAPAIQINTGKGCHLDAHMIGHALDQLQPADGSLLFIENVGNLVCPAAFDLGEACKVVVLSVTEGEDKPLKYPDMFAAAGLVLLNKTDLLPHLDFEVSDCLDAARRVNPDLQTLQVSARTGEGLLTLCAWISSRARLDAAQSIYQSRPPAAPICL